MPGPRNDKLTAWQEVDDLLITWGFAKERLITRAIGLMQPYGYAADVVIGCRLLRSKDRLGSHDVRVLKRIIRSVILHMKFIDWPNDGSPSDAGDGSPQVEPPE